MALWAVAFLGSTPIGGPIAGAVAEHWGGRAGLALGAAACIVAAGMGLLVLRRSAARAAATVPETTALETTVPVPETTVPVGPDVLAEPEVASSV
jgi:hypothetical protein